MYENHTHISELLHKATFLYQKDKVNKEESRLRGEEFNVYRTCGINHYENLHSAILAEWLNPLGTHGQKDLFLSLFLNHAVPDYVGCFDSAHANVATEYSTKEGRLDILISDDLHAIIIENKIYSGDQNAQLKRYEAFAQKAFGVNGFRILYLTLDGSDASEQSGEKVKYAPISYKRTIIDWLDDCVRAIYNKPFLRESLIQYKNLIKQLTGQDMDKSVENDLVAEMLRFPEGVAAIMKAYPAWEKSILEKSLFIPLRKYAEERGLGFVIDDRFWTKNTWGSFSFVIEENLSIMFQYEKQGRNSFYYGIVDKRTNKREKNALPCLEGGNDEWRYGWHYFDMYRNWTIDVIAEIAQDNGIFVKYICDAVEQMMSEMRDNSIID